MFGTTHTATRAPPGHRSGARPTIGSYPYRSLFTSYLAPMFSGCTRAFVEAAPKLNAASLLKDLGGLSEDVLREGEPQCLRRLQVQYELEAHRLLDGQVGRLGPFEDAVHVVGGAVVHLRIVGSIRHQAAHRDKLSPDAHRGQPVLHGEG